jgi:hypothetical protein
MLTYADVCARMLTYADEAVWCGRLCAERAPVLVHYICYVYCIYYACCLYYTLYMLDVLYVSIRQHTSAYVSIRQHTSAYVPADPAACQHAGL